MANKKHNKIISIFQIFFSSIKQYFLYLDKTSKVLAFPIFGQIISLVIIGMLTYYYRNSYDNLQNLLPLFNDENNLYIAFWVVLTPFIIIFVKAMYEYLIALTSLNLLFYTTSGKKKVKQIDFKANNNVIQRKLFNYAVLLLLISILLIVPPFVFVSPIIGLFLCLTLQVFAFEGDISPFAAISRSVSMVKSNIIPTLILIILCFFSTYIFIPDLFIWAFDKISLTPFIINSFEKFINLLPLEELNQLYFGLIPDSLVIAKSSAESVIAFIFISFTMPFRCCCFTELYKLLDSDRIKEFSKESDEIIKRATGKKRKN